MKVVGISGSPRRGGNTDQALDYAFEPLRAAGIEVERISLAGLKIEPCIACGGCAKQPRCTAHRDDLPEIAEKVFAAEGLILASPVYFGCATGPICNLMHRVGYVSKRNGGMLSRKVGGAVAVARRAGHNATFAQLSMFFPINDMVQVGSSYWNVVLAREVGEVQKDDEAIRTLRRFGENLAWALQRLHG